MGDNKPSIKKNFIYSTVYQIFNVLTPLVTAPYISRVIGVDGIGIQSFTNSIQAYFLLFAALGTMSYGTREISMHRDDAYTRSKLFWEIEIITVMTSLVAIAIWCGLIFLSAEYRVYYAVLTIGIFATLFDITWFFNGIEEFRLTVIRNVIIKFIGIVCLFVFVRGPEDLLLYFIITSLQTLIASLSLWPYLNKYLVKVHPKCFRFKHHFRETLIYFIPTVATSVYTVLDRTLIGLITHDTAENGYYQQAEKIINIAKNVVFTAINSVVGVRMAYLYTEKKYDEIHERIENSFNYIFFMGFGCCFGIMAVAKTFVPLFFGAGYDKVEWLLYVFSPIIVVIGVSNCLGSQYYTPCGKRALSAKFIIIGAVLNLCMNILLIPLFGSVGAAIASLGAEIIITVLYILFSDNYGNVKMLVKNGYKKLIAGIIMFFSVYWINGLQMNPMIRVCIQACSGIVVYSIILCVFKDEWTSKFIKKVVNRILKGNK